MTESRPTVDPAPASAPNAEHPPEREESLWLLTVAPAIWLLHFLLCYLTAAIWCAKVAGAGGPLDGVRLAIAGFTAIAVGGILVVGWIGYTRHTYGGSLAPHDDDTPEDRHRFLGLATVLLAALSAVAVAFTATVGLFFESCR
jgi:hypothetical protein